MIKWDLLYMNCKTDTHFLISLANILKINNVHLSLQALMLYQERDTYKWEGSDAAQWTRGQIGTMTTKGQNAKEITLTGRGKS